MVDVDKEEEPVATIPCSDTFYQSMTSEIMLMISLVILHGHSLSTQRGVEEDFETT
jgi:hypothetical protein